MSTTAATTRLSTAGLAAALGFDRDASDLVRINHDQLDRMARHVKDHPAFTDDSRARWDDPLFWDVDAEDAKRSQYFAIGNAINFRFWELLNQRLVPTGGIIEGQYFRGTMYMWRCLRRAVSLPDIDLLDAAFLGRISEHEFDRIFMDDRGVNPLQATRKDRIANLRDLGRRLETSWDGAFFNVVEASQGSLVRFAQLSRDFRAFDDPIYKLTMVNAIVHSGSGLYVFDDQALPAIDYHLVRHALRQGLLCPAPRLAKKLTSLTVLEASEAQELRRVALVAFVELSERSHVSGEILDNGYWSNRVNCADTPVCYDEHARSGCPFLGACDRVVNFALPLEQTRYY